MPSIEGRWVDIFRTGTHRDSSGKKHVVRKYDLDGIVEKFKPDEREVPIGFNPCSDGRVPTGVGSVRVSASAGAFQSLFC